MKKKPTNGFLAELTLLVLMTAAVVAACCLLFVFLKAPPPSIDGAAKTPDVTRTRDTAGSIRVASKVDAAAPPARHRSSNPYNQRRRRHRNPHGHRQPQPPSDGAIPS